MKILEFTAQYKMGHSLMKCKTVVAVRNINYIQQVPEEVPEYADGALSRIQMPTGLDILACDRYDDLVAAWQSAMAEEG